MSNERKKKSMADNKAIQVHDQLLTTGDLLRQIRWRMQALIDGNLPHDTAKLLQRETYLALKVAEITIKGSRESRALRGHGKELNILTGAVEAQEQEGKVV